MDLNTAASIATVVGGVVSIGAVGTFFAKMFGVGKHLMATLQPDDEGRTISEQIKDIRKEMYTNGGSSLRDSVEAARRDALDANERARTAELLGNFERADIRQKLSRIDAKLDDYGAQFSEHLVEANKRAEEIGVRLDKIEKRSA